MPTFPVKDQYLKAVKERVNLARDLDKLQLQVRKANSEAGWLQKAAEEMDIIVEDSYPFIQCCIYVLFHFICFFFLNLYFSARKYDTKEAEQSKKLADLKRKHLTTLLATPIFPKGFSGKYPLLSEELPGTSAESEEKAVDIMKNVIKVNAIEKKKNLPLYKPKKGVVFKRSNVRSIKLPKNVKDRAFRKSGFRKKGKKKLR